MGYDWPWYWWDGLGRMDSSVIGAIINSVPLAFIGWLFVSLNKRIDNLAVRIDKLYELLTEDRKP